MALLPNASIKTKVDVTRSRFEWKRQYSVAPTTNILEEGTLLTRIPDAAGLGEVVIPAVTAGANQHPAGISLQSRISAYTFTKCQDVVVPHALPFTVQLAETNLINLGGDLAEARAYNITAGAAMTVFAYPPAAPPAAISGQVAICPLTGACIFHLDEARDVVRITYRYTLTAIERDMLLRESHVNRGSESIFGLITVAVGHCVVYTSMYKASVAYAPGTHLQCGDGGLFELLAAGTEFGRVVSVPTPNDPYLGVEYVTPA